MSNNQSILNKLKYLKHTIEVSNSVYTRNHEKYDMETLSNFSNMIDRANEIINIYEEGKE
jgi:hypothetical protein